MTSHRISDAQASEFLQIIQILKKEHSDVEAAAEGLVSELVDPIAADALTCWNTLWSKPLYANRDQEAAGEWKDRCNDDLARSGVWLEMSNETGPFAVQKVPIVGSNPVKYEYVARGEVSQRLSSRKVPMDKLAAINRAAKYFRNIANSEAPFSTIALVDKRTVTRLSKDLGSGWGHTTVLHLLTDLGLSCKPDIHLARTCRHLGLDVSSRKNLNLQESLKAVDFVKALLTRCHGKVSRAELRRTDKFLMEASNNKVIDRRPALRAG